MSTPNPLIPQGSFQSKSGGASNVRLAVATIIAIHVVFFGGLLLQGCKRDTAPVETEEPEPVETTNADLTLPPMADSSAGGLYYTNSETLPTDTGTRTTAGAQNVNTGAATGASGTAYADNFTPILPQQPNQKTAPPPTVYNGGLGTSAPAERATREYTIVRGDSFYKIAKENNITIADLQEANPDVAPTRIQPGQKLRVPAPRPSTNGGSGTSNGSSNGGNSISYKVKPGDTLSRIASQHGVTVSEIRDANNMRTSRINAGQTLRIPKKQGADSNKNPRAQNNGQPSNLTF